MSTKKSLKLKLKSLKTSLTKLNSFITGTDDSVFTVTNLETKLRQLDPLLKDFDNVYFKYTDLLDADGSGTDAEEEGEEDEYVEFQEKYFTVQGLIMEKLKSLQGETKQPDVTSTRTVINCSHDNDSGIKIPTINIGKFDGRHENWLKFYENYRVVIHENPKAGNDLRKFHYLISLLEGEAANLIDNIDITESNYEFAFGKLVEFYKNDKKLTETHLSNLFNLKKLDSQSAKGLRDLHNCFVKNINALKKLNATNAEDNVYLTYLLLSKLDDVTLKKWEETTASERTMPVYSTLEEFLIEQYNYLESFENKSATSKKSGDHKKLIPKFEKKNTTSLAINSEKSKNCKICDAKWHPVFKCQSFLKNSIDGRRELVKKISCCWQCLGLNHRVKECQGRKCSKCSGNHNYLLCDKERKPETGKAGSEGNMSEVRQTFGGKKTGSAWQSSNPIQDSLNSQETPTCTCKCNAHNSSSMNSGGLQIKNSTSCVANSASGKHSTIVFPTCLIKFNDSSNQTIVGRFLLDSASELNFIKKNFSDKLALPIHKDEINVYGVGNAKTKSLGYITAHFKSAVTDYSTHASFYIMPQITHGCMLGQSISRHDWKIPPHIELDLADPQFYDPNRQIDGILGVGIFFDSFRQINFHPSTSAAEHYLHKTAFGWVVCGQVSFSDVNDCFNDCNRRACFFTTANLGDIPTQSDNLITKSQKKIWENRECERHFMQNTKIHSDGRFVVSLPFKEPPESLGNSYEGARKRFLHLEKRLTANPELMQAYSEFIREYNDLGHMELVDQHDVHKWPNYYLPHHAVFKESSTTSLRVVFDASFKTSNGLSLNDILMSGPALQNNVFDILTAFRIPKYGLTGDVAKMYRQIWINQSDADFQRILWRDRPDEPIRHYRLKTVSYGTRPAPYLAIRCLHAMADGIQSQEPEIAETIKRKFFMDDYLDGADSLEELKHKQSRMETLFKNRGMVLRKWCSNSVELMDELKNDMDQHYCVNLSDGDTIKALGLTWNPKSDDLVVRVHDHRCGKITKRTICSDLHTFWDPIGVLGPALIKGKIYLQELWLSSYHWDDELSSELQNKWIKFRNQLHDMNGLKIPRRVLIDNVIGMELHGFSDASEKAYGSCIYVRSWDSNGNVVSHLLCSDTHVAPLEQRTLPRLELLAAVTLVNLMDNVVKNMKIGDDVPIHYWSDSEIVLTWINGYTQQWKTFVANRVSHIRESTNPVQWHYVCSAENPADITSRGLSAAQFINKNLWWFGPHWLRDAHSDWPLWCGSYIEPIEQRKISYSLVCIAGGIIELVDRISEWKKLVHVVAWIFRFTFNCQQQSGSENRKKGNLSAWEIQDAKQFILRVVQSIEFPDEVTRLTHKKQLSKKSKLLSLNAYMDNHGILRVGGRIGNASIPKDRRFPIILPYKSHLTEIILRDFHERNYHPGPQALLTLVRGEYWPLSGKTAAKSIVHNCMICRKAAPRPIIPKMASLPAERVTPARPFEICGVDYCGPIYIKFGIRKSVKKKAYIAVFVCFTTKAIHLELVTDLSSQAFLAALKRFFARRGTSRQIHSDNGTNFVGAQKELQFFVKDETIKSECAYLGVEWKFLPPGAPHFGGLWESSVKLVKFHLKRAMAKMVMTFEEAYTLLTGIEACLNSRPLTPLSDDPSDPTPLTPAHFLVGGPLNLPPQPDLTKENLTRRWDRVKQFIQQFWQRWSQEYLSGLQQRNKWRLQRDGIPVGTLVAVKDHNSNPTDWKMARITALLPGKDDITRVATIVFKDGRSTRRPLVKLCPILTDTTHMDLSTMDQDGDHET